MSIKSRSYSIEELLALRDSPLVTKPELPAQMEQWIMQPALEKKALQNSQAHGNVEAESKYRSADSRRSRGDSIILGPPQMSFASSLHSPPLRKSVNKESTISSVRSRTSPPQNDAIPATSPPEEEEEPGWNKVRSAARGNTSRGFERRGLRGERGERGERSDRGERGERGERGDRRAPRESFDGPPAKSTSFRNHREGESQNWRSERAELAASEYARNGRPEQSDFLGEEEEFGGGGGSGKEHSAEEFQAWITKMRGGNAKSEEVAESQNNGSLENGTSNDQPKVDKSKIVDVDSLFALESITLDETANTAPASSVFFDSAPTPGRASRFRQLFAQEPPHQPVQLPQENRPNVDRARSNPMYGNAHKAASASVEDREGFQRIMAMLGGDGGGGGKPGLPAFMDKSPPLMQPMPPHHMQDGPGQNESKDEFFQRLLRQGHAMGPNAPQFASPPMQGPPMPMNRNNGPIDQPRLSPTDFDGSMQNMHSRMNRPPPQQLQRSHHPDPRYQPYDLSPQPLPPPPPPQGAPWMHAPPGFSPPANRFPFPGPNPLSPGLPPPAGGFGPPPPGMMQYGGPPPGFARGAFSPPLPPPPGQDGWHPPSGFGGGYYPDGDGRDR